MACKGCSADINGNEKQLVCGLCESKFHIACVGISSTNSGIMTKFKNIHWFCDNCNSDNIMTELRELRGMKRQRSEINKKIEHLTEKNESRSNLKMSQTLDYHNLGRTLERRSNQ